MSTRYRGNLDSKIPLVVYECDVQGARDVTGWLIGSLLRN